MASAIKEITIQGKSEEYYLFSQISDQKNLSLCIINTGKSDAYFGSANETDLRCMAAEVRMSFSDFFDEMLSAISFENWQNLEFIYTLEVSEEGNYQFKWKKVLDGGSIKISLGCVTVHHKAFDVALSELLSQTSVSLRSLNTQVQDYKDRLRETEKEKANVEAVLKEAVKVKDNIEKEMYTKFVIVLNNKKRKIRELYEALESNQNTKLKVTVDKKKTMKTSKSTNAKRNGDHACKAGPSKTAKQIVEEMLSFSDEEIALPVTKVCRIRRRRQDTSSKLPRIESYCDKTVIYDDGDKNCNSESVDGLLDDL